MLWSGVCFPWHKFDIHSFSCKRYTDVDCNPEYAGIWRPIYGETDDETDDQAQDDGGEEVQTTENSDESKGADNDLGAVEEVTHSVEQNKEEVVPTPVDDDETNSGNVEEQEQEVPESVETGDHSESNEMKDTVVNRETGVETPEGEFPQTEHDFEDKESSGGNSLQITEKTVLTPENAEITHPDTKASLTSYSNKEARNFKPHKKRSVEASVKNNENTASTSTTELAKQQDSSGGYWYWCGSGRYVYTQSAQDENVVCQQLQDPEFVQEEGIVSPNSEWAGHTFLGSQVNPV